MRGSVFAVPIGGLVFHVEDPRLAGGLKATVTVREDEAVRHSDRLNLDRATDRTRFADRARVDPTDLLTVRETVMEALFGQGQAEAEPDEPLDEATALELLHDPALLTGVAKTLQAGGYAGDTTLPVLIYLALTSRLLRRPLNLVITGPSSAGKSYAVQCVCDLMPPAAYYVLNGMSDRVLVYTDADLQHRTLIIGEASSLARDGIAASLLRSVAWEGNVAYELVEKTTEGLKPRRIEKPGPTGFITTTTGRVEAELETRVLTLTVPDTEQVTRTILAATAARANGHAPAAPNLTPWRQAQRWLAERGDREVSIPYAERLAKLVPAKQVRARRDFTQLLTLIQAHALLHQRQRGRDGQGRIMADGRDYAGAYMLAAPVFGAIAAEGVTPAVRETVEAVKTLTTGGVETVSLPRLAGYLKLDKSATSRRVGRCLSGGWLVNDETRKGRPAALRAGDPLPDDVPALPDPAEVSNDLF